MRTGLGILSGILFVTATASASAITEKQITDPKGGKVRFLSGIVNRNTPDHTIDIDVDITGAKKLYLVVGDGGDNYGRDHVAWVEPRISGPAGEKKLTKMKWTYSICGWNSTRVNGGVGGGDIRIKGRKVSEGIGTHTVSVIEYKLPKGYTRLRAQGSLDDTGTKQGGGSTVQFAVITDSISTRQRSVLKVSGAPEVATDVLLEELGDIAGDAPEQVVREFSWTLQDVQGKKRFDRWKEAFKTQVHNRESMILDSDRDPADVALRRAQALVRDLQKNHDLSLRSEAEALRELAAKTADVAIDDRKARFDIFHEIVNLRRRVAFQNPLLKGIDKLLFVKRDAMPDNEGQGGHMCDQYFGHNSTNGGTTRDKYGLFVLEDPFAEKPSVRDLLRDSVVKSGRMKGRKLVGKGGFLAPDVSFDGKQIMFAYSEGSLQKWKTDSSFNIFKVNSDGTGLVQVTDGAKNDFDPCWLPSGRVAFISERRGGYGRCHGRPVPSYTLHSMFDDGTDIMRLSPHETNEWQPSVDSNGMIVYTRWDYVDRGFNQAHHPWITYPDGRDSRAIHGNFRKSGRSAPFLEAYVRAIPGSPRYITIAAAHHGEFRGSVILIDPRVEDDDAMAPVKRVTPEQLLPESETRFHKRGAFATAWPLSEDYYFCVYDHYANGSFGKFDYKRTNYGIYLLDAFGNKELLYRDPEVGCLDPMPLRARKKPPVIPHRTLVGRPRLPNGKKPKPIPPEELPKTALVGLLNVYSTKRPFPEGTKITGLRIFQLLPKTTPGASNPKIGYGSQKGAKQVLGTVPVEKDGSAYFKMPVGMPVLFHALDETGAAIQGMRSATYVKPGEQLLCNGCHERRTNAPARPPKMGLAFRREPSDIKPAPEGSNPFSFARFVQPVLDRKCVGCHEKSRAKGKKSPVLTRGDYKKDRHRWFTSFKNLQKHCFFYTNASFTPASTIPGQFGARRSKLYQMLRKGHHDLKLEPEEWERLIVWMDGNCNFFGSETDIDAQADGKIVKACIE